MTMAAPKLMQDAIEIIKRDTRSTGISLGFPLDATRRDRDWPALAVVASYFGQHRSSNSYLYQRLRELRGLNYGDYAYIEYFPRGMFQFAPDPNLGRTRQIFQIWIRPVEPQNGHFVLRAALYEYDKLVREGMSKEAFEATREFLTKYVNVLTQTQDAQLGYALDSRYYGIPDINTYMRERLKALTLEDVNNAIQRYLLIRPDADCDGHERCGGCARGHHQQHGFTIKSNRRSLARYSKRIRLFRATGSTSNGKTLCRLSSEFSIRW